MIAEGEVATDIQPDLEENGPPSTRGVWTQYVQGVLEEFYTELWPSVGCAAHLESHPCEEFGGRVMQGVIPAYQRRLDDTPFPLRENQYNEPEQGQVRGMVGKELAIVYPENPIVHWAFHGSYSLPSAKLHAYSTPHT